LLGRLRSCASSASTTARELVNKVPGAARRNRD
jgi:hypothetical protein